MAKQNGSKLEAPFFDPKNLQNGLFLIGPDEAVWLLQLNTHNRPILQRAVDRLENEIRTGNWKLTPDAIGIGRDRVLLNGQHRLWAIVNAGSAVLLYVAVNLDPASFDVIDAGRMRTAADALYIEGQECPQMAAAVARLELDWRARAWCGEHRKTSREVAEFTKKLPYLDVTVRAIKEASKNLRALCMASSLAWVYMHAAQQEVDKADEWLEGITSGTGLVDDDPRMAARRRLYGKNDNAHGSRRTLLQIAILWKSWELFRDGTRAQLIRLSQDMQTADDLWPTISHSEKHA